jgi:hypothetical protein
MMMLPSGVRPVAEILRRVGTAAGDEAHAGQMVAGEEDGGGRGVLAHSGRMGEWVRRRARQLTIADVRLFCILPVCTHRSFRDDTAEDRRRACRGLR